MGFIHRVEFASKFLENNIFNHFLQIIIMGGMVVSGVIFKSSRIKGFLLLCSLFLYGYLIGEKFGYFFYILCFLLLGIAINTSNKQCKSYLKYIACFSLGLIFCCITVISTMYKISASEAVVFFEQRVCQDNESWWYFYDKDYDDLNIGDFGFGMDNNKKYAFCISLSKFGNSSYTYYGQNNFNEVPTNINLF